MATHEVWSGIGGEGGGGGGEGRGGEGDTWMLEGYIRYLSVMI